ncbi:SMP-30/gluconolactonase/LRE family protein [Candidatus Sumerlaeota bacterium]|nr:SMP-30/gluconolactonase/LRE family protein [Candidatus Sumerlaeota bacterium]
MEQEFKVEKIAENLAFPEGPVWHPDGYLIFSDVHDFKIVKIKPEGGTEVWFDKGKKTNGLILSNDSKKIYACCYSETELLEIDPATKEYKVLASSFEGRKFNNVNDVAIDAEGNVFFTDPKWGAKEGDIQGVYCYSREGKLSLAAKVDKQPNGLVVSPDQKWLYVDRSGGHDIWRFKLDKGGILSEGAQWVKLEARAEPDGMTIDSKGNLYVAQAGNGKICIISPEGSILQTIPVVPRLATNCEFHDGDESILYVTCGGKQDKREGSVHKIIIMKNDKLKM